VRIGWNTIAQVPVHELADEYVKNFETKFKSGQLVRGKIIKADASEEGHHKMSLRKSVVENDKYKPELGFGDLSVGDIVEAVVAKVEKYGVFIKIKGSKNVRGLCHVSELASERVEDPSKLYSEGDSVKAKIIKLDQAKRNVNFSLKASHFQEGEAEAAAGDDDDGEVEDEDEEMGGVELEDVQDVGSGDENDVESADEDMDDAPQQPTATKKRTATNGLKPAGFDWTGAANNEDDGVPLSEAEQAAPKKKRKKAEIQVDKTGDLDALGPQSVSDFERLLLGQPNSSALWIQYMAFQLGLSEVDKAREVAERALKTIHMREEEDKLNVWVALLNLENAYGNEEGVENVFERACGMCDRKTVFLRLASILIESGKNKVCLPSKASLDVANEMLMYNYSKLKSSSNACARTRIYLVIQHTGSTTRLSS
jgi:rRNA biogenesis protein RRP5